MCEIKLRGKDKYGHMRTIKFRGKSIGRDEWIYGNLFKFGLHPPTNVPCICPCVPTWADAVDIYNVKENTVGQFTGLLDKNGKEIYEGDIITHTKGHISVDGVWKEDKVKRTVTFSGGRFNICDLSEVIDNIEVIGNIHDNKELLGGEQKT